MVFLFCNVATEASPLIRPSATFSPLPGGEGTYLGGSVNGITNDNCFNVSDVLS